MSLFPSSAIPAGTTGYDLEQSLRFNDNDSAYLSWTPTTAGNQKTWTFSAWIKRGSTYASSSQQIFGTARDAGEHVSIFFNTADRLCFEFAGGTEGYRHTEAQYRDPSSWYHIIVACDTTLSDRNSRAKLYVNGEQITSWQLDTGPSLNLDTRINRTIEHGLGRNPFTTGVFDGYLAEVHFIDGTALDQTSFGETGTYGEWKPTAYAGTYGTNGFYLDFSGVNNTIIAATGGTIYTDGDYKYHKFTSDGTFTVTSTQGASIVDALVIAGGGGGGGDNGGGGGAGGYLYTAEHSVSATAYSITVGDGGAGAGGSDAVNGQNSVFSSLTATGGGFGGTNNKTHAGASGGSGGGGGGGTTGGGGSGTAGQGYAGGSSGGNTSPKSGGGGGGAGAVGSPGPSTGTGGIGSNAQSAWATITSSGDSGYYAGGAGAGHEGAGADNVGGTGGGGAGGGPSDTGVAGTANTGGGGGGAGSGGAGGSGIVIIRYKFQ